MSQSKVKRAQRLLNVQNQLLKIEETKAAGLKQQKHQLEDAEQEAIEFLNRVDLTNRFAALSIKRPFRVRQKIAVMDQMIETQKAEVLRKNLNVRMAERVADRRKQEDEREKAEGLLTEITEIVLLRSRLI